MNIGYKIRKRGTSKNDWIIAVIYDLDNWPGRSLNHKGLNDYQFQRPATPAEDADFKKTGSTRLFYVKYTNIQGFLEDEKTSEVPEEFVKKVIDFYNNLK